MDLNVYAPQLQREVGVASFFRYHRGSPFVSSALMDPISQSFVASLEAFAKQEQAPVVQFRKGQRKDDMAAEHLSKVTKDEGVLFIGKAQQRTPVFRTERRSKSFHIENRTMGRVSHGTAGSLCYLRKCHLSELRRARCTLPYGDRDSRC
jgi:hypothetical protein